MIRKFWRYLWGEPIEGERTLLQKLHILLDFLAYWWHRLATSRYVLSLEDRVRMLEAHNTALHATVYGLRGLPPLPSGTISAYKEQPVVMRAPSITPKVDPIMPKRAHVMAEELRRKQTVDTFERTRVKEEKIAEELRVETLRTAREAEERLQEVREVPEPTVEAEESNADVQK